MSVTLKKEWLGESGYCNCLLVAMSRVPIAQVDLFSDRTLPDLEKLTAEKPNTSAWIRSQELQYSTLNSGEVIKILSRSAGLSPFLFWGHTGSIDVHDCVEDDGPVVQRVFHLKQTKRNGVLHLEVKLEGA